MFGRCMPETDDSLSVSTLKTGHRSTKRQFVSPLLYSNRIPCIFVLYQLVAL